jgi:hypothetical protein
MGRVRLCTVTSARITSQFWPTSWPGRITGKIVDYIVFLEPLQLARGTLASLITTSSKSLESIDHISYEGL